MREIRRLIRAVAYECREELDKTLIYLLAATVALLILLFARGQARIRDLTRRIEEGQHTEIVLPGDGELKKRGDYHD